MRLTVKAADGIQLDRGQKERIVFDDGVAGFGLRLREGGSRTWIYQYRIGSKQRRMVLGSAKSVPLGLARENACKLEAKVRLGGDPAADKDAARQEAENTFGALVDTYLKARKSEWRPRSEVEIRRHLTSHAKSLHSECRSLQSDSAMWRPCWATSPVRPATSPATGFGPVSTHSSAG